MPRTVRSSRREIPGALEADVILLRVLALEEHSRLVRSLGRDSAATAPLPRVAPFSALCEHRDKLVVADVPAAASTIVLPR